MFRIKAFYPDGVTTKFLNAQGYWGDRADSAIFTRAQGDKFKREQLNRNLLLDAEDRITVVLEAQ